MSQPLNVIKREAFTHKGVDYEAVFYTDANDPFAISFEVLSNGKRVPLGVAGKGPSIVKFTVDFDTEFDAKVTTGYSALDLLFEEARRMVEASY